MSRAPREVLAGLALLLGGCTGRTPGESASATIADSSDSGSGGSTGSSGTGPGGSSTGPGGSSTGDPTGGACPDLAGDPAVGPAVEVRIVNARDSDVFLADAALCVGSYIAVAAGDGAWPARACETCEQAGVEGCACPKFCLTLPPLRIVPGGRLTTSWNGLVFVEQAVPSGCVPECACLVPRQAPAGTTTITVHELTAEACESAGCGSCTPNADGWCETEQSIENSGTPLERTIAYPRETVAEIVFE